ncbi:hypothetical protein NUW58_g7204 [Xylaria curta]|uniref:Uncharacterized protein n=1 Tax=Xylaria curta TaxID=42375 RepID=A0ACC1NJF8_9PEZI|nr:hypothetical protein NUW58_g7204 [Xylaria curta]
MSGPDLPPPMAEDDIWARNAILIRRLYISERKTLKQVKEVLENQHGFPSFPLSTYETKLRDKLRLRKKLKQADWPAVYQRVQERGERYTGIYINGRLSQLPEGVIVRTPSPTIRSPLLSSSSQLPMPSFHMPIEAQSERTSFHIQGSIPAIGSGHGNILDLSITQHVGAINTPSPVAEILNGFDVLCHRVFLETIPINTLRKGIHSIVGNSFRAPHNSGPASGQQSDVNALGDIMNVVLGLNCGTSSPMRQLGYGYSAPALNLDSYHFLERAIYLLSNKTTSWNDINMAPFDILFTRLQKIVLVQFLRSDHPTARATWEASVPIAWATDRMDVFSFLMNIGLERPDWILDHGHSYLSMAASAGSLDIVRGLLKIGVRADDDIRTIGGLGELLPAIMGAIKAKSMACVEALILGCDVNRVSQFILLAGLVLSDFEYVCDLLTLP